MATSGLTTFTLTVQELIDLSLIDIGALPIGETPSAAEMSDAIRRLNLLIRSLENTGIHLWTTDNEQVVLAAGTEEYYTTSGTNKFLHAFMSYNDSDLPLNIITKEEYDSIAVKDVAGIPTDIYVNYSSDPPIMTFYPVPDAEYTVTYARTRQVESITAAAETIDVSDNALPMVQKGLAYWLGNSFRLPIEERMLLMQEFTTEKILYLSQNTERRGTEKVSPRNMMIV